MYFPLRNLMGRTLMGADFGGLGFKVKRHQVVAAYAPAATTMLLAIPVVVTTLWNLQWWLSPIGALWVVVIVLVMGWFAHQGSVGSDKHSPDRRQVDRHLKEQKSRMRERYRQKD
jgi:fatty acid desaturase